MESRRRSTSVIDEGVAVPQGTVFSTVGGKGATRLSYAAPSTELIGLHPCPGLTAAAALA